MEKFLAPLSLCVWTALAVSSTRAAQGVVGTTTGSECSDYFVIRTDSGYALPEWFGGSAPDKDQKLEGQFDAYWYEDISILPDGDKMQVWVEDYDLSEDDVADKLRDKCS